MGTKEEEHVTNEATYDETAEVEVIRGEPRIDAPDAPVLADGLGCHSGSEMEKAARLAGNSEMLDQFAKDYPKGPHDQPQSMCPAFASLRVGLRMKRVATVLSG